MSVVRRACASIALVLLALSAGPALGDDHRITLGAVLSLSGEHAVNGTHVKNGYDLAVARVNETGGITVGDEAFTLYILYYDDESSPLRGAALVERMIRDDDIHFLLGPYGSGMSKATLPIIEKYRVPMVEANGTTRDLLSRGYRYIFAVLSGSERYLTAAIELAVTYAGKFGKEPEDLTVAMATDNSSASQNARAGVLRDVKSRGISVVLDDQLPADLDDMSTTLSKVQALEPDLLVVSGQEQGAMTAVKQIEALQVEVPMIAMTHCSAAQIETKFPKAASHIICPQHWHRGLKYRGDLFGTAADFASLFEEAFDYEAPAQAAQSAAAVTVFADAFKRAQSLDTEKVRSALAQTDLRTFYGPIKFDQSGRNVAKPLVLTQIIDGRYVIVAPKEHAAQEPVIPRPAR